MRKKRFWLIKVIPFIGVLVLFANIAYQFISLENHSTAVRHQQTQKFAYSLTNLAAAEATRYITQKNEKGLKILIDDLSKDPAVRDATIYDQLGQIIYQSKDVLPLPVILNLGDNFDIDAKGVIPYIAELYVDKTKIGYLRITLEQQQILSLIQQYQEQSQTILALLIFLAFIAGLVVAALSYRNVQIAFREIKLGIAKLLSGIKQSTSKVFK